MDDWLAFQESISWFAPTSATILSKSVSRRCKLTASLEDRYPRLSKLLSIAAVTEISVDKEEYELLAWNSDMGSRSGWLCFRSSEPSLFDAPLFTDHKELLKSFGGIRERFNEPEDTWLLNMNDVLTLREARHDARFLERYRSLFDEDFHRSSAKELPINPVDYYCVAREANGNITLCHRRSGEILLFAPDHCFDFVTVLEGCPAHTLYRIQGGTTFQEWVETIAGQWLTHIA